MKKELTRTRIQKEETARNYEVLQSDYRLAQEKCRQWEDKLVRIEAHMNDMTAQFETNKDERRRLR